MIKYYLAVDIGASSGRHILAHMENEKMCLEEIYRFSNELIERDGHLCWDIDHLFQEVKNGLKKCFSLGKAPISMGIDTWAVDFVLLDEKDQRIGNAVSYRDSRTNHMDEEVYKVISEKELYHRCGIQKQIFNTIYQVMALQKQDPIALSKAKTLLMIPDYLNYCLTGKKYQEYTNATTTGLVNPTTHDWDDELIEKLNYPRELFQNIILPGTHLGDLSREVQKEVGGNCQVVCPPTHDTASAVLAVPSLEDHVLYISSGTWSLMGTQRDEADCSEESRQHNFTNEGGVDFKYRYLKNIMGLWMIQNVKKEFQAKDENYSYAQLCELAQQEEIASLVDCNDARFLAPTSMLDEIQLACEESHQEIPKTAAEFSKVVYQSLANCYKKTKIEIEVMTHQKYSSIHIVGGGSNADYLNELTAKACGCDVYSGPSEATAIGNIMSQMLADHVWENTKEAKKCVYQSFDCQKFECKGEEL